MRNSSDSGSLSTITLNQQLELTAAHSLAAPTKAARA